MSNKVSSHKHPPLQSAQAVLATAAGWCTAVLLAATTGVLIVQGHDGLVYTLGAVAAAAVWALLIVPALAGPSGAASIPGFLATRYGSPWVGGMAAAILLLALAGLLSAEIVAVETVLRQFGPATLAFPVATGVAAIGCLLAARPTAASGNGVAALLPLAILLTIFAVLASLAGRDGPGAFISIPTMSDVTGLEQNLIERRLADPSTFKPHSVPFLRTNAVNFAGLIVCLALGLAMLARPRIEAAPYPTPVAVATRTAARAVIVIAGLVVLLPPLAVAAKRALLSLVSSGVKPSALPEWLANDIASGAAQLCGASGRDAAVLAKACGKGVGPQGLVRWSDLNIGPDAMLFAALDHAAPAAGAFKIAFALAVVAAALWTARRIARLASESVPVLWSAAAAPLIAMAVVFGSASLIAYAKPAGAIVLMTWSASLAAAGLAPVVLSAILARRPSPLAASAAMLAGAGLTLSLILAVQFAPLSLFGWLGMGETVSPAIARKIQAWAAADGPGKEVLRLQAEPLAREGLSWFGIKPPASGVFGLTAGLLVVLIGNMIHSIVRREKTGPSNFP